MIQVTVNTAEIERLLGDMARKMPVVVRNAVNDVAFELRRHYIEQIASTFPTAKPQTKKNIFVMKAKAGQFNSAQAVVLFDQIYGKGIDEYMVANVEGGPRKMKPSEQRLGRFYVPGAGAKLDRYGNMQGGQVTQILSRLGRFGDVAGYDMNQTAASKDRLGRMKKRTGKKATEFFVVERPGGNLKPGVYKRTSTGQSVGRSTAQKLGAGSFQRGQQRGDFFSVVRGRGVTPVLVFTKSAPKYKPVWPFYRTGQALLNKRLPEVTAHYIEQIMGGR
jgi:hypothetical protein